MRNAVLRKILQDDKLYSLTEFRDKVYDDLDLTRSDLAILLCAMLIASIGLNMDSTPIIIGAMLISPLMKPIIGIGDRKSTRLNSSHQTISYAVFCLKKKIRRNGHIPKTGYG